MADVTVVSFSISPEDSAGNVQMDVEVEISRTQIEFDLQIPFDVLGHLRERDGRYRDSFELEPYPRYWWDQPSRGPVLHFKGDDDHGVVFTVGEVPGDAPMVHRLTISSTYARDGLPNEVGKDEFYCVVVARPQIYTGVARSDIDRIR